MTEKTSISTVSANRDFSEVMAGPNGPALRQAAQEDSVAIIEAHEQPQVAISAPQHKTPRPR